MHNEAEQFRVTNLEEAFEDHERTIHLNTKWKSVRVWDVNTGDIIEDCTGEPAYVRYITEDPFSEVGTVSVFALLHAYESSEMWFESYLNDHEIRVLQKL